MSRTAAARLVLEVREGGLAWLTIGSSPEEPPLLGSLLLEALEERIIQIEALAAAERVRAVVLAGEHPDAFVAGSDVDELRSLTDPSAAVRWALSGQRVLRRLEELPVPTVAAIDGPCLEAGLELALACSYRLAADAPATRLGLPQVRLGLIPSLGGTVRLPRLVGVQASLELILPGGAIGAAEALRIGLIDGLFAPEGLRAAVEGFARERIERGRIRTGARRRVPRRLLEDTAPGRRLVFARAARRMVPRVEQAAPAAREALRTIAEGVSLPLEEAFEREAEIAGELIVSEPARALLHALRLLREARRGPDRPPSSPIRRAGVLGAEAVGSEVAYLLTAGELPVILKDRRRNVLLRGARHVLDLLDREERERALSAKEARRRGELVSSGTGWGGFGTLDLVVSSVGEGTEAARETLREAEEHTRADCVLACCSLTTSPSRVQEELKHPEQVLALRFSRPTDLFSLVEIVPGEATDREVIDSCQELVWRLGRTPVVAPDRLDTAGNRLLGRFFAEALRLLEGGTAMDEIDAAAENSGFVLGPFRRMDAMGVPRSLHLLERLGERCGERMHPSAIAGRLTGLPTLFYQYEKGLPHAPNPGLPSGPHEPTSWQAEAIRTWLLLSLVDEAARLLDERPELRPETLDVVALAGIGFPRDQGGPLYYADRLGAGRVVELLREHASRLGDHALPAPLLVELAEAGESFYGTATGHAPPGVLR